MWRIEKSFKKNETIGELKLATRTMVPTTLPSDSMRHSLKRLSREMREEKFGFLFTFVASVFYFQHKVKVNKPLIPGKGATSSSKPLRKRDEDAALVSLSLPSPLADPGLEQTQLWRGRRTAPGR
ncbi:hypothetical protein TGPRC2_239083 [Toxoplasma gondii TgCatPRC2]|uniref:Uncharacterized protein n=3 Tax=Toxoplasma gondii TaxID=5811 RepID=A0A125YYB8_TOXGV|nr:hypothetical protein TGME49_239083 [Toxoplasma gondii ME49]EPT30811.1 hypothetical protein TGME49_239083 [Toxoplasma gondii ME49]ESS31317.1 hypothetical protein TGVEG_239083 [Toxoplasma gondii VEG]KYK66223.1 hypothetical protein TGPRC2_239083 [Toxoplasma gondii TgCatPRC2]|eukprot:XP_018637677.1 hypothetical protein TGME49_239083 [Toxoplasma gondii ME49]